MRQRQWMAAAWLMAASLGACTAPPGTHWDGRRGYGGTGDYGYDLNASRAEAGQYRARADQSRAQYQRENESRRLLAHCFSWKMKDADTRSFDVCQNSQHTSLPHDRSLSARPKIPGRATFRTRASG